VHLIVLICDHFEPRHGILRAGQDRERMETWRHEYPRFRERCRAAFGHAPRHTWFYPPHHGLEHLDTLGDLVLDGHGEVELHYHHDRDDSRSFRQHLGRAIDAYRKRGFLLEAGEPPRTCFSFIHGDWALDNSAPDGSCCGVNDEITALEELGCWGDFTMPSANECQTRKINAIYYAVDDPARPKSHDGGTDARVGIPGKGFFLMQGPLAINWRAPGHPRVENGSLTTSNWGRPDRIRRWISCGIHVKGRPEWVFVKLHAHGAVEHDFDAIFGDRAFAMHQALNESYNDGRRFSLHYATAREAYNLVKAAEAGLDGDPRRFFDYRIARYASSVYRLSAEHRLLACSDRRLSVDEVAEGAATTLRYRGADPWALRGPFRSVAFDGELGVFRIGPHGEGRELILETQVPATPVLGARTVRAEALGAAGHRVTMLAGAGAEVRLRRVQP
jgi:hypothetical protein